MVKLSWKRRSLKPGFVDHCAHAVLWPWHIWSCWSTKSSHQIYLRHGAVGVLRPTKTYQTTGRARLLLRIESSQIQSIYLTISCTGMILRYIRVYGGQPAERLSPVKNVKIQSHWAQDCRRISIWRLVDLDATWRTRELGSSSNSHFDGESQSSTRVICCNWYKHWIRSFAWDTNITLIKLQALLKIQTPWRSLKFRHVSSFQNWTIEFCFAHLSGGVEQSLMARLPRICAVKSLKELSPTLSGDLLHCSDNNAGSCEPCIAFHIRVGQLVCHVQLRNEEIEQYNCDQDSEDDHGDPYSRKLVLDKRGNSSASLKNCGGWSNKCKTGTTSPHASTRESWPLIP